MLEKSLHVSGSLRAFSASGTPQRGNRAAGCAAARTLYLQRRALRSEEEVRRSRNASEELWRAYDVLRAELALIRHDEEFP